MQCVPSINMQLHALWQPYVVWQGVCLRDKKASCSIFVHGAQELQAETAEYRREACSQKPGTDSIFFGKIKAVTLRSHWLYSVPVTENKKVA